MSASLQALTPIMAHGAAPWWRKPLRLTLKYRNLYLMTSACAPKYFPPELIPFMNTRRKDKILFVSDHPALTMEHSAREARAWELRDGVLKKLSYGNAQRVLFDRIRTYDFRESLRTGMEGY